MPTIEVYDPAMCCSTGVCGPSADADLARFAGDLDWLASVGVEVERYNLGNEPGRFAQNVHVRDLLTEKGEDALPVVMVAERVVASGYYPRRDELASWAGLADAVAIVPNAVVVELTAIGAAVASNCEPCLRYHFDAVIKLGISPEQVSLAIRTAQTVKETPAAAIANLAEELLASTLVNDGKAERTEGANPDGAEPCCGGASPAAASPLKISTGCC